jgi:hypothetical protein
MGHAQDQQNSNLQRKSPKDKYIFLYTQQLYV